MVIAGGGGPGNSVGLDEETLEALEESLIASDLGVETSLELVEAVRSEAKRFEGGESERLALGGHDE